MNKRLYEVLFYRLQSETTLLRAALADQMHNSETLNDELVEKAYELLGKLVHTDACAQTLRQQFEPAYQQPRAEPESLTDERWGRLFAALERLDPAYEPPRSTPLTHEELLDRSSAYRNSQEPTHTVHHVEDEDEE